MKPMIRILSSAAALATLLALPAFAEPGAPKSPTRLAYCSAQLQQCMSSAQSSCATPGANRTAASICQTTGIMACTKTWAGKACSQAPEDVGYSSAPIGQFPQTQTPPVQYPQTQFPPTQGQFPVQGGGQYPAPQAGGYPVPQGGQYPDPQTGQYPAAQGGQYPTPQTTQYPVPQGGQFPVTPDMQGQQAGAQFPAAQPQAQSGKDILTPIAAATAFLAMLR